MEEKTKTKFIKRRKITFRVPEDFYAFLNEYALDKLPMSCGNVNQLCRLIIMRFFTKKAIRPSVYYMGPGKQDTCYHCEEWEMNDHGEHHER